MSHVQFAESLKQGQSYVYLVDAKTIQNPRLIVGKIKVHGLKRDPTPSCASGFTCSDAFSNPFQYGHIMAWELGGPNTSHNIVPMYARWQANESITHESWRNMEVAIRDYVNGRNNQFIYVAIVEYANNGDTYAQQSKNFSEWNQLFDWDDFRIPTGFKVYVEPVTSSFGQRLCTEFLTPAGLGTGHGALCNELLVAYGGLATKVFDHTWDHSKLPPQDREALIQNLSAFASEIAFEEHREERELKIGEATTELEGIGLSHSEAAEYAFAPMSPCNEDMYTYINDHYDEVQMVMERDYGLDSAESKRVTTNTMIHGYFHEHPSARNIKIYQKRRDENKKKQEARRLKAAKDLRLKAFMQKRGL